MIFFYKKYVCSRVRENTVESVQTADSKWWLLWFCVQQTRMKNHFLFFGRALCKSCHCVFLLDPLLTSQQPILSCTALVCTGAT